MYLTKDGITIELDHPATIARYQALGFVEVVAAEEAPETDSDYQFAAEQQQIADDTVRPAPKSKKGKVTDA